jgi:hypothetical protein
MDSLNSFGNEKIEYIFDKFSHENILSLLRNPEDAIIHDIPLLVFFNTDCPSNHTITVKNNDIYLCHQSKNSSNPKWKQMTDPNLLIGTIVRHYRKVVDYARSKRLITCLTPIESTLLRDYIAIIESRRDFKVSPFYPGYKIIEGFLCIDDGTIIIKKITESIINLIIQNSKFEKVDWINTTSYANEILD